MHITETPLYFLLLLLFIYQANAQGACSSCNGCSLGSVISAPAPSSLFGSVSLRSITCSGSVLQVTSFSAKATDSGSWGGASSFQITIKDANGNTYLGPTSSAGCFTLVSPVTLKDTTGVITITCSNYVSDCPITYSSITYSCVYPTTSYAWATSQWGSCTSSCGGGTQTRTVQCKTSDSQAFTVSSALCTSTKPSTSQTCNTQLCGAPLGGSCTSSPDCAGSVYCSNGICGGLGATCSTSADCYGSSMFCGYGKCDPCSSYSSCSSCSQSTGCGWCSLSSGFGCSSGTTSGSSTVSCTGTHWRWTTSQCPAFSWQIGSWSTCSGTCGSGTQQRTALCADQYGNIFNDVACGTKPSTSQSCNSCGGVTPVYAWTSGSWSFCSATCGPGQQTRTVSCTSDAGVIVSDSSCGGSKPATSQACTLQACPTTSASSYRSSWVGTYEVGTSGTVCSQQQCCCLSGYVRVSESLVSTTSVTLSSNVQGQCGSTTNVLINIDAASSTQLQALVLGQLMTITKSGNIVTVTNNQYTQCSGSAAMISSSSTYTPSSVSSSSSSNAPIIIGAIVGGVVLFLLFGIVIYCVRSRANVQPTVNLPIQGRTPKKHHTKGGKGARGQDFQAKDSSPPPYSADSNLATVVPV